MDEKVKERVLLLLEDAKTNIAAKKDKEAIEKIDAAISELQTKDLQTLSTDPDKPPLPGEGSNGPE